MPRRFGEVECRHVIRLILCRHNDLRRRCEPATALVFHCWVLPKVNVRPPSELDFALQCTLDTFRTTRGDNSPLFSVDHLILDADNRLSHDG
jgi:hypothetical protein